MTPVQYFQTDKRWASTDYSAKGEKTTIQKSGCGPTCAAMVIASLKDKSVTPVTTVKWSLEKGYKAPHQGTYYSYFVPQMKAYDITATLLNSQNIYKLSNAYANSVHTAINKALKRGNWIIACMGKGNWTSSGHYVLAYKTDGTHVWIHDPASTKAMRIYNTLTFWENEIKYAWEITVPGTTGKKEDDEVVSNKKIAILGTDVSVPTIFKDGTNYVSIKALCEALGLQVTSSGSEPIVSMNTVKLNIKGTDKTISGMNANGTTYAGIRAIAESLGNTVGWEDGKVTIR